jgi:hypothetical protein
MTMFKLTPKQLRKEVIACMEVGLVPMVTSSPGLGKSSIFAQIAKDFGLVMIDLRLSQMAPEDLMGLPMRKEEKAYFAPFEMFPTESTPIPKGMNGWMLNLDECNSAPKSVQAAAYKLILDRYVGQEKLHPNVYIVAAGNLATDKAIVTQQGTAMQSRLIHLELIADHKSSMEHMAKNGYDHRIIGFLEFQPEKLHSFRPDHTDKTFACPRTWEFASRLIKGKAYTDVSIALLAGALSDGVAVELHTFMQEYDKIPKFNRIMQAPKTIEVPVEPSTKYAVLTMILDQVTEQNFETVVEYMLRFPTEFQALFFRGVVHRKPSIKRLPAFAQSIKHLTRFLNDDDYQGIAA